MPPAGRLSAPAVVLEEGSNEANIKAVDVSRSLSEEEEEHAATGEYVWSVTFTADLGEVPELAHKTDALAAGSSSLSLSHSLGQSEASIRV